jgi:hypothetical protein
MSTDLPASVDLPPTTQALHAFLPAFQIECEEYFSDNCSLITDQECLQHRSVLLRPDAPLPGRPRSNKWKWRTIQQYRISATQDLEYIDEKKEKGWKKVIPASRVFSCVTENHCQTLLHAGMDKTEGYITSHYSLLCPVSLLLSKALLCHS